MVIIVVAMMTATIIEKAEDISSASSMIYTHPLFMAAWAALAILGFVDIIFKQLHKRPAVLVIHLSFLLILSGALITHLFSKEGKIHVREGMTVDEPFELTLLDFEVLRTNGGAVMDYSSTVQANGEVSIIAMNRIMKYKGYRVFQAGYDEDEAGSYLSYSYDPWGTGVSYTGYWLLFASLILFFFDKQSRFREALRRLSSGNIIILIILISCFSGTAANARPKVLPKDVADEYGRLYVNYDGRICQVQTMARDYVLKVYGKSGLYGYSAEQVFTGWLLYYDSWKNVPVKCKRKELGGPKELEKVQIVADIAGGRDLKIFPVNHDGNLSWYASASKLPFDIADDEWLFIREVNGLIGEYAFKSDWESIRKVITKISIYQNKTASSYSADLLPSDLKINLERLYNKIGRPFVLSMISLTLGLLLFISLSAGILKRKHRLSKLCRGIILVILIYLSLILALRWVVSSHIPLTNGYEMMLSIAWFSMVVTFFFGKRLDILHCFGFLLSGFAMLVACLGQASPQIGTLMPVLSSPLLSIHVSFMMLSYTMLGILALNSLLGLIRRDDRSSMEIGLVILYPALFFLVAGTFIGAIWANVSWGSYWSWDPKETWALITILVYSAALHSRSLKIFNKPLAFNIFCLLAFLSVLFTYFGVNFILGGAHSYA